MPIVLRGSTSGDTIELPISGLVGGRWFTEDQLGDKGTQSTPEPHITEVSVAVCSVNHYVGEWLWVDYVYVIVLLLLINALNLP